MTKPIGYYTSYTPGEEGLLADMQEEWGATFESLNNCERLWMIVKLAEDLCAENENDIRSSVEDAMERMDELPSGDKVGLIEALVNQVKHFK
ncbi:hypothetical protein [Nostoc sp. UHCC 0870]|uniref:hypothetical protein n=1 Tax=Nostoc sp. UHCC 0870 TaxID=2914041 RepID=UPI001EE0E480|nr:hypothetical protein [Nostoc sp. UHCC 0870]UKP01455.1 hypothetical protein L6494_30080 [Nostoc sp. UHCC 0870]